VKDGRPSVLARGVCHLGTIADGASATRSSSEHERLAVLVLWRWNEEQGSDLMIEDKKLTFSTASSGLKREFACDCGAAPAMR
jgi:hypothetical protein